MGDILTLKKKVVLLGDSAVGKTSMIRRFVEERYDDKYISTLGAKVSKKPVTLSLDEGNIRMVLMVWDLIGSQGYVTSQAKHIASADSILLVHDLTRPGTFGSLQDYWIPLVYNTSHESPAPMIFAGNKSDLLPEPEIPSEQKILEDLMTSDKCGEMLENMDTTLSWQPTSAKTGKNVEETFETIAWLIYRLHKERADRKILSKGELIHGMERKTLLSICDLIVAELPELGMQEMGSLMLDYCFSRASLDKDNPTPAGLRRVIECIYVKAMEMGYDEDLVERARDRWLIEVDRYESRTQS